MLLNSAMVSKLPLGRRFWRLEEQDAGELRYAATVSVWVRWACLLVCVVEVNYRVEYGALSHIVNNLYNLGLMTASGYVWWRIRATGRVDARWLLGLSALDVAALSFSVSMSGGLESRYFPMYYFAVALFCWLFTSSYLAMSWTTMVAAVYVLVCLLAGDGLQVAEQEEKALFYRVLVMYGVAVSANLVTRFERLRGLGALQREGELSRQRIEMSQTIHDTTAQSAYMLGLGLEQAVEMSERGDAALTGKLVAMGELSRSAMWALRHPIDGGEIFGGGRLGEVLESHVDTFTVITGITAELAQQGAEPELSTITRSLLFSIAHNALTNVFRHSGAGSVTIFLEFREGGLSLSVSDDGRGLPESYDALGHGFRNMRADAERLGGVLDVHSDELGTTVSCTAPYERLEGGR